MALLSDDEVFGSQPSGLMSDEEVFGAGQPQQHRPGSILGTLGEGIKSTARAAGATVDTYLNNSDGVVSAAREQQAAPKHEKLEAFYRDIAQRTKAVEAKHQPLPEDASTWDTVKAKGGELLDSIKEVGGAVVANPVGAGHALVEQLPNSGTALAGGWAGMKAGAALGTMAAPGVGTTAGMVIGGLAGMFGANTLLETGNKAMEAGQDGSFTGEERTPAMQEGAIKGGVITGVDALTLGASKWITGATTRAMSSAAEVATRRALTDAGIDIADEAAVLAARTNPAIQATVQQAQAEAIEAARLATDTFGKNALRYGAAGALETVGEGLGEYLGELAATGDASMMDAVLESVLSLGQSGAEVAWGALRNKSEAPQADTSGQTLDGLGQGMDQTSAEMAGAMDNFTSMAPPSAGLLTAPPPAPERPEVIIVPNNAGGETVIDRKAGPLSAALVDTGITQDLLNTQTLLRSFPDQAAAQAELEARPDADRYTIARHPRAKDRFAVVPKDRQTLAALDGAKARQQQLSEEEGATDGRTDQGGSEGTGVVGSTSGEPVAGMLGGLRAGDGISGDSPTLDVASAPLGDAGLTDQALIGDATQTELAPAATQPVSEMPGQVAQREQRLAQARLEAQARGATLVDEEASLAAPEPTPAQIAAGNYKKGHLKVGPLNIAVENPVGSLRKGQENGKAWETQMQAHYGYVKRTTGADGDQVDVFLKEGTASDFTGTVYVIDQFNPATGRFDEHKAMIGYRSQAEAAVAYDAHFADGSGPKRRRAVVAMPMESFARWAREGNTAQAVSQAGQQADAAQAEIEQSTGKFSPKRGETQAQYHERKAAESNAKKQRRAEQTTEQTTEAPKAAPTDDRRTVREALESGDAEIIKPGDLPSLGKAGKTLSRQAAKQIEQLARLFGKKVVIFSNRDGKKTDGFWMKGNTIYLNADSSVSQLRVLGHELTHAMRKDAPAAFQAMFDAVKHLLTDEQVRAQWADYHDGQELVGEITEAQRDFIAEEWMADLAGNRFGESAFWTDVFAQISAQYGEKSAKNIINQLRLAIAKAINQLLKAIQGGKFSVDARMAEHLEQVRAAVAKGFADYAVQVKRGVTPTEDSGVEFAGDRKPGSDVGHKRTAAGAYVGAPAGMTPAKLGALRTRLMALADEGKEGRMWYEESSMAILAAAEGDKALAEKISGLLAIYSPNATVSANTTLGLKALYQWANGEPISVRFKVQDAKAQAWMDGTIDENAAMQIKTGNFHRNLMRKIDEENYGFEQQGATIDMWMARVFGYGSKVIGSEARYLFAEREIKRLAEKLSWEPQQVQAALWVAIKSRIEAIADQARETGQAKGWLDRKVVKVKGKENISWPPKPEFREEYETLMLNLAMGLDPDPSGLLKASYNFGTALQERVGQISWEAMPGKTTGVLPGIFDAPLAQQAEYLAAMDKALRDENGADLIAKKLNLPILSTVFGPSAWEMNVGAGAQTQVVVATDRDEKNKVVVSKATASLLNVYAAIRGLVLNQEAVVWHFPIYDAAKKMANGVQLDFGRDPTHDEVVSLYNAIHRLSGRDDWAPAFVPGVGVRVLNFAGPQFDKETKLWSFKDKSGKTHKSADFDEVDAKAHEEGVSNRAFQKLVKAAAASLPEALTVSVDTFKSEGDYIGNDWKESPNGEDYRQRISGTGPSDLQGWVESELRPRAERVNQEFARKYGWDKPKFSPNRPRAGNEGSTGSLRAPSYGAGQPGAVSKTGVHYSKQERKALAGHFYGQGMKGAEGGRLQRESANPEQLRRVHFYVDEGKGIRPESDVGPHAHRVSLENLYDLNADPLNLWPEARAAYSDPLDRTNKMEQLILERGFDGVYVPQAQGTQGVAVLLGKKHVAVPVEYLGTGYRGGDAKAQAPQPKAADPILSDPKLPAGQLLGSRWKELLAGRLEGVEKLDDSKRYYRDEAVRAARADVKLSPARLLTAAWSRLAEDPAVFQYPKSEAETMQGVFKDLGLGFNVSERFILSDKEKKKGITKKWVVKTPDGKPAEVFRNDKDEIWVNASMLKANVSRGSALYAGLLNYAHNSMGKLIGDPLGVSDMAIFRRTENMVSSALKFGTTEHMAPAPEQESPESFAGTMSHMNGITEKFAPLAWSEDQQENLARLLHVSYTNISTLVPEVKEAYYDFVSGEFRWSAADRPVTKGDFARLTGALRRGLGDLTIRVEQPDTSGADQLPAVSPGAVRGIATLQRAIITHTLLRAASSADGGRSILAAIGAELRGRLGGEGQASPRPDPKLPGILYSSKRLAPNGKPSKLTEQQWHQVRTPEFKAWFGDWEKYATTPSGVWADGKGAVSKVVDSETGEPLVVYHGSEKGGFTVLDPNKGDKHRSPMIFTAASRNTSRSYSGSGDEIAMPVVPKTQDEFENYGFEFNANEDGTVEVVDPNGYAIKAAAKDMAAAIQAAAKDMEENAADYTVQQRGVYSLFLNIRNPHEAYFEGANWDGEAPWGTYEVFDGTGDQVYGKDGRRYFSLEEAEQLAEEVGGDFQDAQGPGETTNTVAEDAKRYGHDGTIIRQVTDDGGKGGYVEPDDVFVIFDANQAKSATQNTGAFSRDSDDLRFSTARKPWYFSQLARTVEAAPAKVFGTAAQVRLWLTGNAPKMGVKKDELQWSGVMDWLELQGKAKVSKEDVLAYLDQNGVQVQEVEKGEERNLTLEEAERIAAEGGKLMAIEKRNQNRAGNAQNDEGAILPYIIKNFDKYLIREGDADAYVKREVGTKYDQYALPGGENYRELLLTLPEKEPRNLNDIAQDMFGKRFSDLEDDDDANAVTRAEREQKSAENFKSSHWDEKNILAHVRFNDRTDAEGNKVLFIEELQSDWGQEGKKKGFGGKVEWLVKAKGGVIMEILGSEQEAKEYAASRPWGGSAQIERNEVKGVPAAPFVTDTKAWLALGVKRMIAYAVEKGYDKIAFVNGEQSAERYDLSKHIDEVRYQLNGRDTWQVEASKGGRVVWENTDATARIIEDTLGKEIASKIANDEGVSVRGTSSRKSLSGLDLKVGGEGMKTFYDQIVPQVVGDVLKKLGGGKVETVEINTDPNANNEYKIVERDDGQFALRGRYDSNSGWAPYGVHPSREAAQRRIDDLRGGVVRSEQLGFTITPEMQAKVAEGLPLFSPARRISDIIDRTIAKVDHAVDGLSNLPNQFDYLKDRYLALGKVARVDEIVQEIRDAFTKTDPANKKAVYDYLTTRGARSSSIPDAKVRSMAERIKKTIEYVGDQLVARGLLDPEAREHYRDQYLPRMYLRHMLNDQDYKVIGMGKKPSEMGYLKHRKDIPEEIREVVLGEIKDPAFLSANAIGRAMRDVSLLDWMGKIAQNNDWTFPDIFVDWQGKRVTAYWLRAEADHIELQSEHYEPAAQKKAEALVAAMRKAANQALGKASAIDHKKYKQIPDTRRYGLLRGMWVRREIFDDIMGASQIVNAEPTWFEDWFGFGGKGTKLTQWWKFSKVALNPPGQIRNFLSNMVMLQLSGVGLHKLPFRLIEAARDIANDGPYWKVAKKYGVTESTFTAQEMFRVKRDLMELEAQAGKMNSLRWLMSAGAAFLDKVSDLYQFSEALGKTIKIIDEMKKGKSEAEAAIEAQKWLFDYSLVPQSVRLARNAPIGMPFITYQIKVLPRLMEVAAKHPWRFLPWAGLLYGMQMAVASLFGVDDDELEKLKKALPEWLQDRGHTVFLPWRDDDGRIQVADVGYFFPWTWFSTMGKHAADGKIEKVLVDDIGGQFSAPIIGAAAALMTNYDTFTKRPIYNSADPVSYQAASIANYAYDLMAPPFLSSHGVVSPMGLLDKKFGGKMTQALMDTTNRFGDPKATEAQAIGALVGANFYGMDPEHTRITNMQVMNAKVRDVERQLRYRLMDQGLTPEQRTKYLEDYKARMQELALEMQEYSKASEVPEALKVRR